LELELARRNIPFRKYGGLRFMETAHVKDLLAFLRLAENPRDLMAGTRVLQLIPGIGPKKARDLMERLTVAGSDSPFQVWTEIPAPSPAAGLWRSFVALMTGLRQEQAADLATQIQQVRLFYAPFAERIYDNARARLQDLEQLEWLAARFRDRAQFLAEIALDPPSYSEDFAGVPLLDEDYLVLSTMHSAKGLEWDVVFVIHAADGNIPSDMATGRAEEIEEERRLFYVALTRAKDWLYVCHPLRYYAYPRSFSDAYGYAPLTRFLSPQTRAFFTQRLASEVTTDTESHGPATEAGEGAQGFTTPVTTEDIRQRLKDFL
ncbi:MAG: ATP-dependent helicase, partial [Thermoleophilia bacterium]|nr:ATP-dependent helicase [Thermoleophilia bacterium]